MIRGALCWRALGDIEGKLHNDDAWKILKLSPQDRSSNDRQRLDLIMKSLGWERVVIRFSGEVTARGFRRGLDKRAIYVFADPLDGSIYYVGHDTKRTILPSEP
jgi:hypothetical protein